jgi:hypothetical protein
MGFKWSDCEAYLEHVGLRGMRKLLAVILNLSRVGERSVDWRHTARQMRL